jgi:hypothetical protein
MMQPPIDHGDGLSAPAPRIDGSSISTDEAKVVELVEQFHAALAAGRKPDRTKLLEAYPEIASELQACLDGLELVDRAVPAMLASAARDAEPLPPTGQL